MTTAVDTNVVVALWDRSQGIGLISMEARLKLVNGTFSIESQPRRGTRIHAHVPLNVESDPLRAAG